MPRRTEREAEGGGALNVVVSDPQASRRSIVDRVASESGVDVRVITAVGDVAALDAAPGVAAVALAAEAALRRQSLDIIAGLSGKNLAVVAYGDGADGWPLGVRAQCLVAGAATLLDSAAPSFEAALHGWLVQTIRARREESSAAESLQARMRALGLVGESLAMMALFRWIVRASALSDLPTLITGETGTGKELVARAIHHLDVKRQRGPFVPVNCAALAPTLAETELFGHRRGAFTGSERDRRGLFRTADGGVLFLDEIGELDATLQAKLLRVLQENRILAVGDDVEVAVSVRVMAATNRDLSAMVGAGRFREDLFHRLDVVSYRVPPLRQRGADVALLVEHFVEKYRSLNRLATGPIGRDFLEALTNLELPGNARQLENLVRWTVVSKRDQRAFGLGDLPPDVLRELSAQLGDPAERPPGGGDAAADTGARSADAVAPHLAALLAANGWNLARSLDQCERAFLEVALRASSGNQARMARMLEITPRSVYNKLRKHRLRAS